jgi:hypothetical protein
MAAVTIDSGLFRNPNRDLAVNITGTKKPQVDDYSYPKQDWFWTGKKPVFGECPGVREDGHMTSLPLPDVSQVSVLATPARRRVSGGVRACGRRAPFRGMFFP